MALSVLPPLLQEEVAPSYLSRARQLSRLSKSDFAQHVLNVAFSRLDWAMPTGITAIARTVGRYLGAAEPLYWLQFHTLAPFWSSTLSPERRGQYEQRLLATKPGPRKPLLPIAASEWFSTAPALCPECDCLNAAAQGFSHIQRAWLLPFATRCAIHGVPIEHCPQWSPGERGSGSPVARLPNRKEAGTQLARQFAPLLDNGCLLAELGSLVRSRGYTTRSGRLRRLALCELLLRYSKNRHEHPELDRLLSTLSSVQRVLQPLWSSRSNLHPVIALELANALRQEPQMQGQLEFVSVRENARRALVSALENSRTATEAARKAGVSVTTATVQALAQGVAVRLRPKALKPQVRDSLEELLATGVSMERAARACKVSLSSAYRVLAAKPQLESARAALKHEKKLQDARTAWLALIETNPDFGTKALRALNPAVYARLYRFDRDWLRVASPAAKQNADYRRTGRTPLGADLVLASRIHSVAQAASQVGMSCRATRTMLSTAAGRPGRRVTPGEAPLSNQVLLDVAESLRTFVYRRLAQAAVDVHNKGFALSVWRVERQSRLRPQTIVRSGIVTEQVIGDMRAAALERGACERLRNA